jgi:hypothetical protein
MMEINHDNDYRFDRPTRSLAEHSTAPRSGMELNRSSSFARSFFQSAGHNVGDVEEFDEDGVGGGRSTIQIQPGGQGSVNIPAGHNNRNTSNTNTLLVDQEVAAAHDDDDVDVDVHRSRSSTASSLSPNHGDLSDDHNNNHNNISISQHSSHQHRHQSHHQVHVEGMPTRDLADRRRSRRRLSRGSLSGSSSHDLMAMAAAAAAETSSDLYDTEEPIHNLPHQDGGMITTTRINTTTTSTTAGRDYIDTNENDDSSIAAIPRPGPMVDRQTSWYTDALLQGGGSADLSAFLGQIMQSSDTELGGVQQNDGTTTTTTMGGSGGARMNGGSGSGNVTDDDDEVLEQYRIMAHVEASIRVKDNTGFDLADYEKRRKTQPEPMKGEYYSGSMKPKPKIPEPKRLNAMDGGGALMGLLTPQEPPPPSHSRRTRKNSQAVSSETRLPPRGQDLCPGIVIRNSNQAIHIPDGEHAVRCLGCQCKMRVNLYAALVLCPDCKTVSPATTTRG